MTSCAKHDCNLCKIFIQHCNYGLILLVEIEFCIDDGFNNMMTFSPHPVLSAEYYHPSRGSYGASGYLPSLTRVQILYRACGCPLMERKKTISLQIRKQYRFSVVQRALLTWINPKDGQYDPPKYPMGVNLLYCVYFCACLMERTWRFALPLVLANLDGMLIAEPHPR